MQLKPLRIILASSSLLFAVQGHTLTASTNIAVSANVLPNCSISSSPVAFGNYDPIVANAITPLDTTGTVTVHCTASAAASITLNQGANSDTGSTADIPLRRLTNGSDFLNYQLYSDAAHTTIWGGTLLSDVVHMGTGFNTGLTVYGRIPAGQNVPQGTYTDTVVATIDF